MVVKRCGPKDRSYSAVVEPLEVPQGLAARACAPESVGRSADFSVDVDRAFVVERADGVVQPLRQNLDECFESVIRKLFVGNGRARDESVICGW